MWPNLFDNSLNLSLTFIIAKHSSTAFRPWITTGIWSLLAWYSWALKTVSWAEMVVCEGFLFPLPLSRPISPNATHFGWRKARSRSFSTWSSQNNALWGWRPKAPHTPCSLRTSLKNFRLPQEGWSQKLAMQPEIFLGKSLFSTKLLKVDRCCSRQNI